MPFALPPRILMLMAPDLGGTARLLILCPRRRKITVPLAPTQFPITGRQVLSKTRPTTVTQLRTTVHMFVIHRTGEGTQKMSTLFLRITRAITRTIDPTSLQGQGKCFHLSIPMRTTSTLQPLLLAVQVPT